MKPGARLDIEHIPLLAKLRPVPYSVASMDENPFHLYADSWFCDLVKAVISINPSDTVMSEEQALYRQAVDSVQAAMAVSTGEIRLDRDALFTILAKEIESFREDFCNKDAEFQKSLAIVVALEVARLQQAKAGSGINIFLSRLGFTDIHQERVKTNSFNGRSNSWMISATKG